MKRSFSLALLAAAFASLPMAARASGEVKATDAPGKTVYAVFLSPAGQPWQGTAFAAYADASWASYAVPVPELGGSSLYVGSVPTGITTPGRYSFAVYEQQGASPALADPVRAAGSVDWTGTTAATLQAVQSTATANGTGIVSANSALTALASAVALAQKAGQPVTLPALPPVTLAPTQAFNNTGQTTAPGWLGISSVLLPADHTAIQADVAGVPASTIAAMKADATLARTFNRSYGKYTYNVTTHVMTLLNDDGTPLTTVTLTSDVTGPITGKQ